MFTIFPVTLSFNDFVDICRKEPVTTADDLLKAFRKIDINGDGYISLDELYKIMNGVKHCKILSPWDIFLLIRTYSVVDILSHV